MENHERSKAGKVRAVCHDCGKKSAWVAPDSTGQPEVFDMVPGWSVAPYPVDYLHIDGSHGSQFWCPSCNRRRYK